MLKQTLLDNFNSTFGKPFDRKALSKLVTKQLKTKEDEYYMNLISHLSAEKLIALKDHLNGNTN